MSRGYAEESQGMEEMAGDEREPGPPVSLEQAHFAAQCRARQEGLIERLMQPKEDDPEGWTRAQSEYDATVSELEAIHGADAPCAMVDPLLFDFYSDTYKDAHGFRPDGTITRKDAQAWVDRQTRKSAEESNDKPAAGLRRRA